MNLFYSAKVSCKQDVNNCINRSVSKIFGVTGAEGVKDVSFRNFIALDDVAVLVERRTVKFVDKLIDSNSCGSSRKTNEGRMTLNS